MEHSALPRHFPKLPLVHQHFVEMLLRCLMGMSFGKRAKRSHISGKVGACPAIDKLSVGAGGRQSAPSGEIRGFHAKEDREQRWAGLGVGAPNQEIGVSPAGWMRPDVEI